jgi:hypothetical protein
MPTGKNRPQPDIDGPELAAAKPTFAPRGRLSVMNSHRNTASATMKALRDIFEENRGQVF